MIQHTALRKKYGKYADLKSKVGTSGKEEVWLCPYCVSEVGKEDTKGKIYFNTKKRVGVCFMCETVILDETIPDLESNLKSLANGIAKAILGEHEEDEYEIREYNLAGWTTPVCDNPKVHAYAKRRKISDALIERYNLLACKSPVLGLVFPNQFLSETTTDFVQIRDVRDEAWIKYRNVSGDKPIYGIASIGDRRKGVIAEGTISGISASRVGNDIAGLASYGKSLTEIHLRLLKSLDIDEYYVMYDGGYFGSAVKACNQLLKTGKLVNLCMLPFGVDPNEATYAQLSETYEKYTMRYRSNSVGSYLFRTYSFHYSKSDYGERAWLKTRQVVRFG